MFRSKVSSLLRNITSKNSFNNGRTNLLQCSLLSTEQSLVSTSNTEEPPDKLYSKIEVEVRGNDRAVLKSYGIFTTAAAEHLNITMGRNVAPYKAIHERLTVLKSVHVHKKHRVQYERRTYYRYLDFFNLTGSTADTFLEYIQRNLPEGVAMKVTKVERRTMPDSIKTSELYKTE
ncbi:28S ribosomal protein S10, mitochondrial isoform X1 [Colletes gigas]|uniref:28S ribosomal protein S10, mitochondrial isoform X1 n=1 Tax=Colletes gigas TaxID=935657 RepID=UPI001C9B5DF0|nr:28S ribosomal protein S10, mitochondrial isoform X1 [Colletes gigas]